MKEFEVVHRAADRADARLVADVLERHGLDCFVQDPTPGGTCDDGSTGFIIRVWVRAGDAEAANAMLDAVGHHLPQSLDNPPGETDDTWLP